MAYAEGTTVPVERSIAEIVALIKKAGAQRIAQLDEPGMFALQFFLKDRMLRFRIAYPGVDEMPARDGHGRPLSIAQRQIKAGKAQMQRARALLLVIKAKLESVESCVETFEEAFLANVVTSDGRTIGEIAVPQIADSYAKGAPVLMLTAQSAA